MFQLSLCYRAARLIDFLGLELEITVRKLLRIMVFCLKSLLVGLREARFLRGKVPKPTLV